MSHTGPYLVALCIALPHPSIHPDNLTVSVAFLTSCSLHCFTDAILPDIPSLNDPPPSSSIQFLFSLQNPFKQYCLRKPSPVLGSAFHFPVL